MSDAEPLTVVVPTRNRPQLLARCLESVAAALRDGDELIVADASSSEYDVEAIVESFGARLIRCVPPGASRQRNAGACQSRHEIVAFIDDDVRVAPHWASALAGSFGAHPDAAFLTGRLDVPPEQSGYSRAVSVKSEAEGIPLTRASRGTLGHSANMAVRRSAFQRVGGFDERLGPGARFRAAEDGDLIDRLIAADYEGRYEPDALGWHDQWRSRTDLIRLEYSYGIGMGARLARLRRSDRTRAKALASDYLWTNALRVLPSHVVGRHEFAIMYVIARVTGAVRGFVMATVSGFGVHSPSRLG